MDLPSQSPDENLIENVWPMKSKLKAKKGVISALKINLV